MNKQQREYAMGRVERVLRKKHDDITKKHRVDMVKLTTSQKLDIIYSKQPPPMVHRAKIEDSYSSWVALFDFSGYERGEVIDDEAIEREMAPLRTKATKLKDEIMLGDAKEALKLIQEWVIEGERT